MMIADFNSHIADKWDKILERIDRRIDEGLSENRGDSIRLFTFAMTFFTIMIWLVNKIRNPIY